MSSPVIKVINVTKRFGRKTILRNINLTINSGEIFGIIGMSGSGKTTLLNTMIGFLQPEAGDVLFKHEHLLHFKEDSRQYRSAIKHPNEVKTLFGFSSQSPSLYTDLTCEENLHYFGELYNVPKSIRKTNIDILMNLMGINESRKVKAGMLSGGMRKRLDIACALIHDPRILILDEPTSDLDPVLRKQMWDLIREINRKGTTVILSSHFLDELERFCDRVCILYDSQLMITGTPGDVKTYYTKEKEIHLEIESKDYSHFTKSLEKKKEELKISEIRVEEKKLVVYTLKAERTLRYVLQLLKQTNEDLVDVNVEDPSLQEVLEMISKKK